jgi:hypothetical protein
MATLTPLTLLDLRSSVQTVDGGIIRVAEILVEDNEALTDIPWVAGNLLTGDIHYKRTVMPFAQKRLVNQGVKASVSKKEAETDTCVEIASRSVVDMGELRIAPDAAAYLALEARPHIAVMGETVVRTLFHGDGSDGVLGLRTRYNKINNAPKDRARQIIDAEGAGTNLTSVYIVKWDSQELSGIYPKNTAMGLETTTLTNQLVPDKDGELFRAHITDYSQFIGLKLRDPRFVARVCNIDMDDMTTDAAARRKLFQLLITAKNRIWHASQGRVVMYMNPDLANIVELAAFEKENTVVGYKDGITKDTRILTFSGIPIRRNDFQSEPDSKVV